MNHNNIIEQLKLAPATHHDQDGVVYFENQTYDHPSMAEENVVVLSHLKHHPTERYSFIATYSLPYCNGKIRWIWSDERNGFVPHMNLFQDDRGYVSLVQEIMGLEAFDKYGARVMDNSGVVKTVTITEERFMDWLLAELEWRK